MSLWSNGDPGSNPTSDKKFLSEKCLIGPIQILHLKCTIHLDQCIFTYQWSCTNDTWIEIEIKALHSELLAELSGRFSSRNEYFRISEVRIVRHFFEVFGKFGISKLPKLPNIRKNQFPKFPKFFQNFRTFSELFSKLFRTF